MELNLNFSDLKTFEEAVEIQRSLEGENSDIKSFGGTNSIKKTPGIYVLTPFKVPYYVGLSTVRGKKYWNLQRVIQHVKKIKSNSCTYVIFKSIVYKSAFPKRDIMIPRLYQPTKPPINFLAYARSFALFWREKKGLGFLNPSILINPSNPWLPVSNVKDPLRSQISHVVNTVFSSPDFSFFYLEVPQIIGMTNEKEVLKCLETIVKYSLMTNTVSDSLKINSIAGKLKSFGISKITIACPNVAIKNLFYPFPHDDNHNPVSALRGVVNII